MGNLFQKAVYLGVGLACYAGDQATKNFGDLKDQAQKLADELVERGEMTTEEARKMVDDLVNRSQATTVQSQPVDEAPRKIEIEVDDAPASTAEPTANASTNASTSASPSSSTPSNSPEQSPEQEQAEALRRQVEDLRAQLERLKNS